MLGLLRALFPSDAFAQTWPKLISHWTLDETSGPSFADSGHVANVPMEGVGTWADLPTASLIQGAGGTSAYTNGAGYARLAANHPDHDLSELKGRMHTAAFRRPRPRAPAFAILVRRPSCSSGGAAWGSPGRPPRTDVVRRHCGP
jgi:hypothetical protein